MLQTCGYDQADVAGTPAAPRPGDPADPGYPFTLKQSLLPDATRRPVAYALLAATVAAFTFLGLAILGVPGLAGVWAPLAIAAAGASLALLVGSGTSVSLRASQSPSPSSSSPSLIPAGQIGSRAERGSQDIADMPWA